MGHCTGCGRCCRRRGFTVVSLRRECGGAGATRAASAASQCCHSAVAAAVDLLAMVQLPLVHTCAAHRADLYSAVARTSILSMRTCSSGGDAPFFQVPRPQLERTDRRNAGAPYPYQLACWHAQVHDLPSKSPNYYRMQAAPTSSSGLSLFGLVLTCGGGKDRVGQMLTGGCRAGTRARGDVVHSHSVRCSL